MQNFTLSKQNEKIALLVEEIAGLKTRLDESKGKDEIIRKLELQLEEARS